MKAKLFWIGGVVVLLLIFCVTVVGAAADKTILCHKPGTSAEGTLEVATASVQAHLDHGDVLGECAGGSPNDMCTAINDPGYDGVYTEVTLSGLVPVGTEVITITNDTGGNVWFIFFTQTWGPFIDTVTMPDYFYLGGWRPGIPVDIGWKSDTEVDWTVTCNP